MDMKQSKELAARITQVRTNSGLNKVEFGRILSVSTSYISYLETGEKAGEPVNPKESLLFMISYKFGVSLEWLKTGKGPMMAGNRSSIIARLVELNNEQLKEVEKLIDRLQKGDPKDPPTPRRHSNGGGSGLETQVARSSFKQLS